MARRLLVALLLASSLGVSVVVGIVAADWPRWKHVLTEQSAPPR